MTFSKSNVLDQQFYDENWAGGYFTRKDTTDLKKLYYLSILQFNIFKMEILISKAWKTSLCAATLNYFQDKISWRRVKNGL